LILGLGGASPPVHALPPFQPLVDATPVGGELRPEPGEYAGPVRITHPVRIVADGQVTIRNKGRGTVITIRSNDVLLRGLHMTGSGENHDTLDAGVQVRGDRNTIESNRIDDCLFGIDLQRSDGNLIQGNRIRSKETDLGLRGDGIRLWYSEGNRIVENEIRDARDTVVWYSKDNVIARNRSSGGRYALHFMYSQGNLVEENVYSGNLVGIFLMYSDDVVVLRNRISRSVGPTGMGIGFKETSGVRIEENAILHSAVGIYLDISPLQPDKENLLLANHIAYNGAGIAFHNDWSGNVIRGNRFKGNFTQVVVRGGGGATRNEWTGNHWDDYRGFDRDGDGRGDTPHDVYDYADRLWIDVPAAAFFRGSPLLEALDFLERLAPFTAPTLVLRDASPILKDEPGG
jgi:nitrous oxidase accessory protein